MRWLRFEPRWKPRVTQPSSPETPLARLDSTESPAPKRNWTSAALAGIVVLALAIRLWGITWALPNENRYFTYHPDEGVNLISGVLENGAFRPHAELGFYNYGTLYFYLWQAVGAANRAYGLVSLPGTDPPRNPSPESPASLILLGRILTAIMGAMTAWAGFALGFRLFGRAAGLITALLLALIPVAVVHGHFATVDVTATFFVTCSLVFGARLLEVIRWKDAALAAVFCGLAAATKYNAGLILIAPVCAALLNREDGRRKVPAVFIVVTAAAAAFLIACPGLLLNSDKFLADFTYEIRKSGEGMGLLFAETGNGWIYHLKSSLRYGLGIPLLLFSLSALGLGVWKKKPQDLYLLSFFALYYFVIGAAQVRFMRYVIPLLPVIAVLCGRLTAGEWTEKGGIRRMTQIAGAVVILLTAGISVGLTRLMVEPDSRDRALAFIRERISNGSVLAFARTPWYDVPPLSPAFTVPSPQARREAAATIPGYAVRLPEPDRELDLSVFDSTPPDAVFLSDIATQDWERLKAPVWMAFKERLEDYSPHVFENLPSICGFGLGKPGHTPNDLLYIFPRITVYTRNP